MKRGKKVIRTLLLILLGIVLMLILVISFFTVKNTKAMNECLESTLSELKKEHTVTELSPGGYSKMSIYGIMKFHVKQYEIKELGNLSVMTVNVGVMQMVSIIFTPCEKDLPLLSIDNMYMLGTRKSYLELYDLVEEKDASYQSWMKKYTDAKAAYADLQDITTSKAWYDDLLTVSSYKTGGPRDDSRLNSLITDIVSIYLKQADSMELLNAEQKAAKAARMKQYSDNLIEYGGISTDIFKKSLGDEVTRDFFDHVLFGTERYQE